MSRLGKRLGAIIKSLLGTELHLFLAYALIIFRPGATPPVVPLAGAPLAKPVPEDWSAQELTAFIEEARLDVAAQQADKRDIRARAQVTLTTAIVIGGAGVTSMSGKSELCACGLLLYLLAALAVVAALLASGGIISAKSEIGTVSVSALTHYAADELHRTIADGYASTRLVGAQTIASLVTVLRDSVLALVLGSALLAIAHLTQ